MNIHEYQAKQLLRRYGVPVPRGDVAQNPAEAETIAEELDGPVWVVKAQIHAGGRGKGKFKDDPNGKGGIEKIVEVKFNAEEKAMFDKSVAAVKSLVEATKKIAAAA